MASRTVIKKAVNLPVTSTTLANGVPFAPLLNFNARASTSEAIEFAEHNHTHEAHGHRAAPRAPWAGGAVRSSSGLCSTTFINGALVVENTGSHWPSFAGLEYPLTNYRNHSLS